MRAVGAATINWASPAIAAVLNKLSEGGAALCPLPDLQILIS